MTEEMYTENNEELQTTREERKVAVLENITKLLSGENGPFYALLAGMVMAYAMHRNWHARP